MSMWLDYVQNQIAKLKDDLQHCTMVEKDSILASQIKYDLENLSNIEEHLEDKEKYEDFVQEICNYLGLDNLFPYNNLKEIEKQIKTLADNSHWIAVMQDQKKLKALEIIKYKKVDCYQDIVDSDSYEEYLDNFEYQIKLGNWNRKAVLSKEEYDYLKEGLLWKKFYKLNIVTPNKKPTNF